ncbi:hypothetical protein COO60DRAFT_1697133 [Scenedesmus sp. NREL 46B-D3]|nr:hypothetical protein COO60DRAFT_1697133 [Scenedesmus sp. NREL 46B-D3]
MGDVFGRNFGAAGSALQGLLRKLGANFEDMMPMSGVRIKGIMAGMKQFDDEGAQLSSLSELCELLSISTEESLTTFPIEQVVPLLVQLLGMEHNPDIMLLAARALTFMADVLPASCGAIVRHGAVPAFCERLLTIEYIDLAEQSLQALEKLSHEHPQALLQHGGLLAVLSFLDFFPTGVQRTAVATAATMCTGLGPSHVSAVKDALPVLCNLLQYQDAKVVDNACMALLHIAEAYAHHAPLLEQLQSAGLINQALQLISINEGGAAGSSAQTSVGTYFGMIKLLSTCASGSAAIAQQLLKAGVIDTLRQLLANCAMLGSSGSVSGSVLRTPDQLFEVMTLAHELLPAVPDAGDMLLRDLPTHGGAAVAAAAGSSGAAAAATGGVGQTDVLAAFLASEPEMVLTICQSLLPLTLQVYSSTVMPTVRSRCLATVVKLLALGSPSQLQAVLAELPISSFVAGLLCGRDVKAQAAAIQMAEILMAQLPHIFAGFFVKEGVAHALEQLAASSPAAAAAGARAAEVAAAAAAGEGGGAGRRSSGAGASAELPPPSPPITRSRRSSKADQAREEPKESAAAAAADRAGASAAVESLRSPSLSLRDAVARRAAAFKQQHFKADGAGAAAGLESEGLQELRHLCDQLAKDDSCVPALLEALTSNNLSVFEMISSSAVNRLTAYLQGADLPAADQNDEQLLRRLRNFTTAALASHADAAAGGAAGMQGTAAVSGTGAAAVASAAASSVPLAALVRKLQAALASAEAFPVLCSRLVPSGGVAGGSGARSLSRSGGMSGSFNSSSLTSGLAALTQPFKLRLVRHPEEHALKEYPANIVLIEPLANMTAIEDFLWQRVNRGSTLEALRVRAAADPAAGGSRAAEPAAVNSAPAAAAAAAPSGPAAAAAPGRATAPAAAGAAPRRRSSSGGGSSKDGSAGRGQRPAASKAQPIPEADGAGRMTRAQAARARAQAQARAEAAVSQRRVQRAGGCSAGGAAGAAAGGGSTDGMSDEHEGASEEDLLMPSDHDDEHMHDDGMDEDHDMDDGIFDHEDDDEDEDEDMDDADIGSMPVHDLHLAEGMAAAAAAAAAAASQAAAAAASDSRAAADSAAAASRAAAEAAAPAAAAAAAGGGGAGSSDARAPWARSSAAPPHPPAANGAARTAAAVAGAGAGPKLVFLMGEQPLAASCTVFQAIQQSTLAANGGDEEDNGDEAGLGGSGRRGRQLWEQVYTLHYRLAGTESQQQAAAAATATAGPSSRAGSGALAGPSRQSSMGRQGSLPTAAAAAAGETATTTAAGDAVSHWRQSPLGELLSVQLPPNLAAPESCLDILRLVQLLEVINRLAPRMLASHELQLLPGGAAAGAPGTAAAHAAAGSAQPSTAEEEALGIAAVQAAAGQMALAHVPRDEFVSSKLGNKLAQQLKDVLSICGGGIPAWCHQLVASCRFLFPFEVRRRYFYSTAFGLGRALHHMHQQQAVEGVGGALARDGRELRIGRLQRQKVRVSRRRILDSAVKVSMGRAAVAGAWQQQQQGEVMELYAKHRAVLELEYFGEVGTGLGPTLEFYTMLSHELQRKALGMWRHEEPPEPEQQQQQHPLDETPANGADAAAVTAAAAAASTGKAGLPGSGEAGQQQQQQQRRQAVALWAAGRAAGRPAVAAAMRAAASTAADYVYAPHGLFPAPLPEPKRGAHAAVVEHFRLLGRAVAKALQDNRLLDLPLNPVFFRAALGKPLDLFDVGQVDPVLGASLERLAAAAAAHAAAAGPGLFTLPGEPAYELCAGGCDVLVDSSNLVRYIQAVVDASLGAGIQAQMAAFREGFNEVFSMSALEVFRDDEMEVLLCGAGEHWTPQQLADSMKFDHGYTAQSAPVRHLLEILSELDTSDQRRFLRFVTGCPRLPPGGIAALQPRLTVVRKHPSLAASMDWSNGTQLADGDLPSVMTCANYIKLPPYSCKDVMRERIMFAIREGQGSFDLS